MSNFSTNQIYNTSNMVDYLRHYDYTEVFKSSNHPTYGFYGEHKKRLKVRIVSVTKDLKNPNEYFVYGKTKRNEIIRPFIGKIIIQKNYKTEDIKNSSPIQSTLQGIIMATYIFYESAENSTVFFEGMVYSKWYVNTKDEVKYDVRNMLFADQFSNNAFIGRMITEDNSIVCNWADYFPPEAGDLVTKNTTQFIPNVKYVEEG
ncbi:hypothetical protein [Aquimarina sp. U1-2]|uniref:hypothetical protein n=1 Tax=Aquimarina sp. U1-2 TaxID=2823141 RepID=UPI001AEC7A9C|nr:hypothetical protein [Aquimarina sp. U1-2]